MNRIKKGFVEEGFEARPIALNYSGSQKALSVVFRASGLQEVGLGVVGPVPHETMHRFRVWFKAPEGKGLCGLPGF